MAFDNVEPATLKKIAVLPEIEVADTGLAVDAANNAFQTFKKPPPVSVPDGSAGRMTFA